MAICLHISWSFQIKKYNTLVIMSMSMPWMIWPVSVVSFSSFLVCGTQLSVTASVAELSSHYVGLSNGDTSSCRLPFTPSALQIISLVFLFLFWIFSHMPACWWAEFSWGHPSDLCWSSCSAYFSLLSWALFFTQLSLASCHCGRQQWIIIRRVGSWYSRVS